MLNFTPSPTDNKEVYGAYLEALSSLKEAAANFKRLEHLLCDKFMAVTKTDRAPLEECVTTICSASWGLTVQGVRVKQKRLKERIMTACDTELTDKETL